MHYILFIFYNYRIHFDTSDFSLKNRLRSESPDPLLNLTKSYSSQSPSQNPLSAFSVESYLFSCLQLTDPLCHCPHRTERTPCAGFIQQHHDQPDQRRGQHHTIEAKAELYRPCRHITCRIRPAPRHIDRPEQLQHFLYICCTAAHQPCLEQHVAEHTQKEDQKSIPKAFGAHPSGRRFSCAFQLFPQYGK